MGSYSKNLGRRVRGKHIDVKPFNSNGLTWGGYEIKPGKGKRDGNCNRTACQAPLEGQEQWTMRDHETMVEGKRLYYCGVCARDFNNHDVRMGWEPRCTLEVDPFACEGIEDTAEAVQC